MVPIRLNKFRLQFRNHVGFIFQSVEIDGIRPKKLTDMFTHTQPKNNEWDPKANEIGRFGETESNKCRLCRFASYYLRELKNKKTIQSRKCMVYVSCTMYNVHCTRHLLLNSNFRNFGIFASTWFAT